MKRASMLLRSAGAALLVVAASLAHAQGVAAANYPDKPIYVIFPFPPGSPVEAVGRVIVERASRLLGQPMVFENKPGANGIIGTSQVARARPDGYTIQMTTTSAFEMNGFLHKNLPYDPERGFVPVVALVDVPVTLIVSSRLQVNSIGEFAQYVKTHPAKVAYGSIGNGSFNHLLMEQFKSVAGVDMLHVPFQGSGAVATELLAGRIDATVLAPIGPWAPNQVKLLALMSPKRSPLLPDVPAITEAYPSFRPFVNWLGVVAPANTPAAVVEKLNRVFNTVLHQPEVRAKVAEQQWSVIGGTPEEFRATIARDTKTIGSAFERAGIKAE